MQKFNYHQHTYRCGHADMDMQDEDYIKEYIKMGFKKIAFTDHNPEKEKIDERPNVRMEYSKRKDYLADIKKLKEKYAGIIEIETGYEAEYLPGQEENLMELKQEVDKIVLGQHFVYDDNSNIKFTHGGGNFTDTEVIEYAKYIEKAMELGIPDIIAHPDLFMYVRENFGELESRVSHIICMAAEKYNIPLEMNLHDIFKKVYNKNAKENKLSIEEKKEKLKSVRYPYKEFWDIAANYNIKVLYGIDAHHKGEILLFNELVQFANEILGDKILSKLNFMK